MRSLDLLYMFICFNLGVWFVGVVTGGFGYGAMDFNTIAVVSVASLAGGVGIGGLANLLTGADPLKVAVIGLFSIGVIALFGFSTAILLPIAIDIDNVSSTSLYVPFYGIFMLIEGLITVIGISQFVAGGFKANE